MAGVVGKELPLLRSSERATYHRCPQAWYWGYVDCLRPIAERKTAAEFGTIVHLCMAEYYQPGVKRGPHPAETWERLAQDVINVLRVKEQVDEEEIATWEDFYTLGRNLLEEYVIEYAGDPHWDVLDAERNFAVTIPDIRYPPILKDGRKGYRPICTLVGVFDLCYRDLNDGHIKMVDHKTANQLSTLHLDLDPQASTYIAVATKALQDQGLINKDDYVKGMEYNFLRKGKIFKEPLKQHYIDALINSYAKDGIEVDPASFKKLLKDELAAEAERCKLKVHGERSETPLFRREFVARTPRERNKTIMRISQEAAIMERTAAGDIPVTKSFAKDCNFCNFYNLCSLDEGSEPEDVEYFIETVYKKVDPYADHRTKKVEH
jgi:hypothetical protein